ncbi:protein HEADING DATE REPRESSOR 1 [Impatiens glandulifera]|uniref:protein HEADING DATE REPRESSOR 1 n=1 Tax=Impatiens glandulifera TaxID=253017 RepID=UPI001FB15C68|nr:protein HEADING DATE REPRESSOR 1 [Impatiens glandulifera]
MGNPNLKVAGGGLTVGFSPISSTPPPVFSKSRTRSASSTQNIKNDDANDKVNEEIFLHMEETKNDPINENNVVLSERRKALFEPLKPMRNINGKRPSAENLLPPPDFDSTTYPRGWLIGKKRKLVNVDVVESMRRIAVQEMNRKDREIEGLNEQLEEDAKCMEHLQIQLMEEKSNRAHQERENVRLQSQTDMLLSLLQENEPMEDVEATHES